MGPGCWSARLLIRGRTEVVQSERSDQSPARSAPGQGRNLSGSAAWLPAASCCPSNSALACSCICTETLLLPPSRAQAPHQATAASRQGLLELVLDHPHALSKLSAHGSRWAVPSFSFALAPPIPYALPLRSGGAPADLCCLSGACGTCGLLALVQGLLYSRLNRQSSFRNRAGPGLHLGAAG